MAQIRILFKGNQIKIAPLSEDQTVIGSDDDCGIYIDSLAVQPYHALILKHKDSITVRAIEAEHPLLMSGEEVLQEKIQDGGLFNIGKYSFQYESGNPDARVENNDIEPIFNKEKQKEAWLQVLNGPNLGKTINLHRSMTNIGKKGAQLDIIARRSDGYYITHLEGKANPKINGQVIISGICIDQQEAISVFVKNTNIWSARSTN